MIMLPVPWKGKLKLLIILEDENVLRIKQHDCAEIHWAKLAPEHAQLLPDTISIGYASPQEMQQIIKWITEGNPIEALKLVTGGFKFRPEMGDHDRGPQPL